MLLGKRNNSSFPGVEAISMHRLCYLWVLASAPSLLASCAPLASPCSAFKDADVVGIVRLEAAWHPTRFQTESRGFIVKSYKGPLRPGMSIDFYGGGVCYDAPYRVGAVHVVYAKRLSDGRYSTDCTRTHVMGESTGDVEFLERFSSRLWLAALLEPLGCNERHLPPWLYRLWIWNLQRTSRPA
jgi:hypothetical protein